MTKIVKSGDCGNSPKNQFAQDLAIAIAKRDSKFLLDVATDDFTWNKVGHQLIDNKESLEEVVLASKEVEEVVIDRVTTHGRVGAANGTLRYADGTSAGFCHVYSFGNTKGTNIRTITSYVIELQ